MVQAFIEYTKTDGYKRFKENYMKKYKTSEIWYDYNKCIEIFGTICIPNYYWEKNMKQPYNSYTLLMAYLALFDKEEFERYKWCYGNAYEANEYIKKFLNKEIIETSDRDVEIVKKWIKQKEALYGSQDYTI